MSQFNASLPLLGFAAYSGTGKTTLLEAMLPKLVERGIRVAESLNMLTTTLTSTKKVKTATVCVKQVQARC